MESEERLKCINHQFISSFYPLQIDIFHSMLLASFKSTSFIIILDLVGLSLYSIGQDGNIFQPKLESNIITWFFLYFCPG
jgi:hypothetical protein